MIATNNPIVQFLSNCIDSGVIQNTCLKLAKKAGIPHRRQNAQVLYKFLKMEKEILDQPCTTSPEVLYEAPPPFALYDKVRQFFIDAFQDDDFFDRFKYEESEMSECGIDEVNIEDADEIQPKDFLFEIGERGNNPHFVYWGHVQNGEWKLRKSFPALNMTVLLNMVSR